MFVYFCTIDFSSFFLGGGGLNLIRAPYPIGKKPTFIEYMQKQTIKPFMKLHQQLISSITADKIIIIFFRKRVTQIKKGSWSYWMNSIYSKIIVLIPSEFRAIIHNNLRTPNRNSILPKAIFVLYNLIGRLKIDNLAD